MVKKWLLNVRKRFKAAPKVLQILEAKKEKKTGMLTKRVKVLVVWTVYRFIFYQSVLLY